MTPASHAPYFRAASEDGLSAPLTCTGKPTSSAPTISRSTSDLKNAPSSPLRSRTSKGNANLRSAQLTASPTRTVP